MKRKVLTYQAPLQLFRSDSIFQQEYKDCLHIVATSSLKKGLGESIRMHRWIDAPIITFAELLTEISGRDWSSSKAQLKQFLYLSDIFTAKWEQKQGQSFHVLQSFERNQLQVLKTMRTLTELEIHSSFIEKNRGNLTEIESFFLDIWKEMDSMLKRDSTKLRKIFDDSFGKKKILREALDNWEKSLFNKRDAKTLLKRRNSNLPFDGSEKAIDLSLKKGKLILHGFYFITPIQERVFKSLEKEYELVFLNSYDSRFPNTFETVKSFLGIGENTVCKAVEEDIPIHPLASKLIESFEGESELKLDQIATEYHDLTHFIQNDRDYYSRLDKLEVPYHIYTPRAAEVEKQLIANEFVPSVEKKLTDYPVGRFLYRLYQLKSRSNNLESGIVTFQENVTAEALLDCFSSGCLIVDGEDMRKYVKPLEQIIPFCVKVSSFKQWKEQISYLIHEKDSWEAIVLKNNAFALSSRNHIFHSLPMRQLSYFTVAKEELEKIRDAVEHLEKIHNLLFEGWDSKKINIAEHLKTLEKYVLKDVEAYFENEEKKIVSKLIEDISELKDEEMEFTIKDISQGLMFYLDGTLKDLENNNVTTEKIFSFDNVDGAPFRINRKFHLAFVDNKALPIPQGYNLWPLSRDSLQRIMKECPELRLLEERKKQSNSITRYLLYVLFHEADDVRFSFAKQLGKESRLELALYLKLLGIQVKPVSREMKPSEREIKPRITDDNNINNNWTISMEREAKVCGKRATFSFILNEHTTFKSDFHHGFLYQNFIAVYNYLFDKKLDTSEIKSVVDKWFPQWLNMKREFLFESRKKKRTPKKDRILLDGKKYSQAISYLHLLPNSYASLDPDAVNALNQEDIVLYQSNPGDNCMYCPYQSFCVDAQYPIDKEGEREKTERQGTRVAQKITSGLQNQQSSRKNFSITDYIKSRGVETIDKRDKGGCLWIVGDENLQPLITELASMGKIFNYVEKGGRATKHRSAWFYKGS